MLEAEEQKTNMWTNHITFWMVSEHFLEPVEAISNLHQQSDQQVSFFVLSLQILTHRTHVFAPNHIVSFLLLWGASATFFSLSIPESYEKILTKGTKAIEYNSMF